jgi:hypothetical protein
MLGLPILFASSNLVGATNEALPDQGFNLPANPKPTLVDSAQDSARFTLSKTATASPPTADCYTWSSRGMPRIYGGISKPHWLILKPR